ncbi:PREDICTED: uncharacterized protein LOC108359360 [Rhagoletis zephyria]|uniref:uncharacterized protein LOC108359360 n=1 Tax=Rhagoletis zephyria TaxID=28612 RepID=UPI0008114EE6|nr:PREDICTED: uncharacterized protein LOC108359360 [Rhagoletis zephyria]XP_036329479.1 uncharacterized protein LOC118741593 [Rhagoletis pomonella]
MVQKHRSASKATLAKDVSPMRVMAVNKKALASSPATNTAARLSLPTAAASSKNADKWKYNNMVNNQRELFNNLHFY